MFDNYLLITYVHQQFREPSFIIGAEDDLDTLIKNHSIHLSNVWFCGHLIGHYSFKYRRMLLFSEYFDFNNRYDIRLYHKLADIFKKYAYDHHVNFEIAPSWSYKACDVDLPFPPTKKGV